MTADKHVAPMDGGIRKLRLGSWRLGWKTDAREGMHIRSTFISRPTLECGCWRFWVGRLFIGRKCSPSRRQVND